MDADTVFALAMVAVVIVVFGIGMASLFFGKKRTPPPEGLSDLTDPANPLSPLSPANPANPISPINPLNLNR